VIEALITLSAFAIENIATYISLCKHSDVSDINVTMFQLSAPTSPSKHVASTSFCFAFFHPVPINQHTQLFKTALAAQHLFSTSPMVFYRWWFIFFILGLLCHLCFSYYVFFSKLVLAMSRSFSSLFFNFDFGEFVPFSSHFIVVSFHSIVARLYYRLSCFIQSSCHCVSSSYISCFIVFLLRLLLVYCIFITMHHIMIFTYYWIIWVQFIQHHILSFFLTSQRTRYL